MESWLVNWLVHTSFMRKVSDSAEIGGVPDGELGTCVLLKLGQSKQSTWHCLHHPLISLRVTSPAYFNDIRPGRLHLTNRHARFVAKTSLILHEVLLVGRLCHQARQRERGGGGCWGGVEAQAVDGEPVIFFHDFLTSDNLGKRSPTERGQT